jgi:membrane-bound metal-dependent hydrolase YbcI (DUF457 family)
MFIGHFAVALAAKPLAPKASLGTLFAAAQFIDLLWPSLLLLGIERVRIVPGITTVTPLDFEHYPFSHSLAAVIGWAAAFALVHFAFRRDRRTALVLAALVLSHWLLDALMHHPDLPLWPGSSTRIGLGAWDSLRLTLEIELTLLILGVWLYAWHTAALDRTGHWALVAFVAFLVLVNAANLLGPPPPSVAAIGWVGQAQWLLVAWGWWIDRHRRPALRRGHPNGAG